MAVIADVTRRRMKEKKGRGATHEKEDSSRRPVQTLLTAVSVSPSTLSYDGFVPEFVGLYSAEMMCHRERSRMSLSPSLYTPHALAVSSDDKAYDAREESSEGEGLEDRTAFRCCRCFVVKNPLLEADKVKGREKERRRKRDVEEKESTRRTFSF